MAADLGSIVAHLRLEMGEFTNNLNVARQQVVSTAESFNGIQAAGSALKGVGTALTAAITVPVVALGTTAIKTAMQTKESMSKVNSILQLSGKQWKDYQNELKEGANDLEMAYSDYTNAAYEAVSAGVKQADVTSFLSQANQLAVGGLTNLTSATDLLTTVQNAYNMSQKDMAHVSDVLIQTQNLGKVTVDELASSMGKVIPTANNLGVSVDQLGTGYAIMTAKGIAAAESTTYINSMYNELGKSGTQVSNILKQQTGKSFQELTASGKSTGDILQILSDYAKNSGKSLSDLFGSVEAGKAALTLMSGGAEGFNKTLDEMTNSTGSAKKAFEEMNNTPTKQFEHAMSECKNAASDFGEAFLPVVTTIAEAATQFMKMASSVARNHPELIKIIGALGVLLATIGPLALLVGTFMASINKLRESWVMLKTLFSLISGPILSALQTAMIGIYVFIMDSVVPALTSLWGVLMSNPIILVITAIVALVAGFIYLWNNCEGFREFWINLWNVICTTAQNAWNSVVTFFTVSMPQWFNSVIQWFQQLPGQIWYWLVYCVTYAILWVAQMKQKAFEAGAQFIHSVIEWFKTLPERIWRWLLMAVNNAIAWKNSMVAKAREAGKAFIDGAINWFKALPGRIWQWLVNTVNKVLQWKRDMEQKAKDTAKSFVDKVKDGIKNLPSNMLQIGKSICKGLADGIWGGIKWVTDAAKGIAKQAEKDARATLKINSPSKVFRDRIGKSIPEGMAIGIETNADSVYKTLRNLSNNLSSNINVSGLMDSINIRTSDINVNSKNSNAGLVTEIKGLIEVVKSNSTIDYDKMAKGFEKAVNKIDNTIVMDKTVVGKMTAKTVNEENKIANKQKSRFRGEVDYV